MSSSTSPERPPRKKRTRLILILGLIVLGAAAGAIVLLLPPKPTRTDFPNYEALVKKMPGYPAGFRYTRQGVVPIEGPMRYPTEKELRHFAVLWPTRPPEENAFTDYVYACENFFAQYYQGTAPYAFNQMYSGGASLDRKVEKNKHPMAKLQGAFQKEYFAVPILILKANGAPMFDAVFLSKMREMCRACFDAGLYAELQGRTGDAARWYLTSLQMGRHMRHGTLIQSFMGLPMCAAATQALNNLIENGAMKDQTLQEIISFCEAEPPIAEEIAFVLDAEEEWLCAQAKLSGRGAEILADQCRSIRTARKAFAAPLNILIRYDKSWSRPAARQAGSDMEEQLHRWRRDMARRQVEMEALKTRAAIGLYKNATGAIPQSLEMLVPRYLRQLPLDPYTGDPLQYAQNGTMWQLRSAGLDTKINGDEPSRVQLQGDFWKKHSAGDEVASDFVFVSTLDSNVNVQQDMRPNADAAWYKMHPEDAPPTQPGNTLPPGTLPPGMIWAVPNN